MRKAAPPVTTVGTVSQQRSQPGEAIGARDQECGARDQGERPHPKADPDRATGRGTRGDQCGHQWRRDGEVVGRQARRDQRGTDEQAGEQPAGGEVGVGRGAQRHHGVASFIGPRRPMIHPGPVGQPVGPPAPPDCTGPVAIGGRMHHQMVVGRPSPGWSRLPPGRLPAPARSAASTRTPVPLLRLCRRPILGLAPGPSPGRGGAHECSPTIVGRGRAASGPGPGPWLPPPSWSARWSCRLPQPIAARTVSSILPSRRAAARPRPPSSLRSCIAVPTRPRPRGSASTSAAIPTSCRRRAATGRTVSCSAGRARFRAGLTMSSSAPRAARTTSSRRSKREA
jgi:hypothetical protein